MRSAGADRRPSPDALLKAAGSAGRLKIFLGAAPGVGKTFAMLTAAQARRREGVDLVAGLVETHGREETAALLEGLEIIPRRPIAYRDRRLEEMDLDAILARHPRLVLVDELAHTNAPGSRHPKRHLDVEELLAAGIDVYTTLNIQHLESLNDVVARITGVRVRETVPDSIIDRADEVEVVDLTPEDLLDRLREGKVYVPAEAARAAGATVRQERLQGKGHVVRRMFADVEADVYVLVDGDGTYDPGAAPGMVRLLLAEQLDMVNGARETAIAAAYRRGHRLGNRMLTGMVGALFGRRIGDMLSGYRVFSRRFVKSFPAFSTGFETETELTVHALELDMPIAEITTSYRDRPHGGVSKLRTYRDGVRILRNILVLLKQERPLPLFSAIGAVLLAAGLGLGLPVVTEFVATGLVPRLPSAVLAASLVGLSFLAFTSGLILDAVTRARAEAKRLAYLAIPAPRAEGPEA
jgi:hypothetical protein